MANSDYQPYQLHQGGDKLRSSTPRHSGSISSSLFQAVLTQTTSSLPALVKCDLSQKLILSRDGLASPLQKESQFDSLIPTRCIDASPSEEDTHQHPELHIIKELKTSRGISLGKYPPCCDDPARPHVTTQLRPNRHGRREPSCRRCHLLE